SVKELKAKMDGGEEFLLVDVREAWERDVCTIEGSKHIPMGEVLSRADELKGHPTVIMQCRSGGRSGNVVNALEMQLGMENLYNLTGGILAWANEIDTSLEQY
ncbi:MAG: rhodanese-like domain-containing protein, partial [Flavobacteriales bacterium]